MDERESRNEAAALEALRGQGQRCPHPDLLLAAREGILPEELGQSVADHVAGCALCAVFAQDLADLTLSAPTAQEESRIQARLKRQSGSGERRRWIWFAVPALAGAAAVFVFLLARTPGRAPAPEGTAPVVMARIEKPPVRLPLAPPLVWRGGGQDPQAMIKELSAALEPFRADRFPEAVSKLSTFTARHPQSAEGHFYLGVSLLLLGRKVEAADVLQKAQDLAEAPLAAEAARYLDLARK